ncbi:MAG: hypothetical protein GY778_02275 [bacterium]|nr:hypothetical protein [bacterium]
MGKRELVCEEGAFTGETAVLELVTVNRVGGLGFGIDEYVAGFVDLAPPEDEHQQRAICPPDDKENAICYELSHPVEYDHGRAVARLLIGGSGLCTGWLASGQDHLVTNNHCIGSASEALNTDYEFMAEAPTCASGNCQLCWPGVVFSGATLIQTSSNLDYALVQINSGNPAATYGFLEIDDRVAIPGEQIYIPQHPGGRAKEFAIFSTHASDVGGLALVNSITAPPCNGTGFFDVGYFADTEGGSSGSPVIASSSNQVIALHHCANCPNRGVPIHLVCDEICDLLGPGPAGTMALDKGLYGCNDVIAIELRDGDLAGTGTHAVTVDSSGGDSETVVLTETGAGTAIFLGSIPTSTTAGAGVLEVAHGDTVTVTYIDANDGQGGINVVVRDSAGVDCLPPNILSVQTTTVLPRSAVVTINADEPVQGTVYYGLSCASLADSATGSGFATSATVDVVGIQDNQTYFYSVEATDEGGNTSADDNGGNCYTFTTPEVPDFFTEEFTGGDNDLENFTILLVPDASVDEYALCGYTTVALPTDPAGGTALLLTDNGSQLINFGPDSVVLYGVPYTGLFVNANGNVTFNSADTTANETPTAHFSQPRISALFDDLNPAAGGTISWKHEADRIAVTWQDVPEAGAANANTFQVEMYFDGRIQLSWLGLGAADGIVGLSEGLGVSPDFFETNLSGAGTCGPRPPSAQSKHVSVPEDGTAVIDLLAVDDGLPAPPTLDYIVTALPNAELKDAGTGQVITPGDLPYTLDGGGFQVIFTPAPGVSGPDSFQFKANDGGVPPDGGDSNIATISISIEPVLDPPFFDGFPTTTFDPFKWDVVVNADIDGNGLNPPSSPFSARFNGSPDGGDEIRTFTFDLAGYGGVQLEYAWQRTGGGEHPDAGDDLYIEYLDATGAWQVLNQHLGGGTDMTTFQAESLLLPVEALHSNFRLRIRNTATSGAFDDWFVDNVFIYSLDTPEAFDGAATAQVNGFVDIALQADDPNGDALNYVILSLPTEGLLSDPNGGMIAAVPYVLAGQANTVRYTPATGYNGPDGFTFETNDGSNTSNTANIGITVGGRQPVHSFSMDTDPGWATEGDWAWGVPTGGGSYNGDPTSGFTGSNVYGYNLAGDYPNGMATTLYLTTTDLDCTGVTGSELRFRRWLGVEVFVFDHANLEISTNGSTWAPLWTHDGDAIIESAWSLQSFDISAVADGQSTVYFRWGMGPTDGSASYPGWNLDDIEVWGDVPVTTVAIAGARSCLDHGGTEWCLDLTTNGIEPRLGPTTLEFDLTDSVATVSAVVACQTNLYAGSVATALVDADTVRLTMSPLPDEDCCTITLSGDAGDTYVVQTLAGDVNLSGRVNATDKNLTKGQINKAIDAETYLMDVNATGAINATDKNLVKGWINNLPPCP